MKTILRRPMLGFELVSALALASQESREPQQTQGLQDKADESFPPVRSYQLQGKSQWPSRGWFGNAHRDFLPGHDPSLLVPLERFLESVEGVCGSACRLQPSYYRLQRGRGRLAFHTAPRQVNIYL